ncbi:uncharacterized protein HKW66_Vig0205010 [Vigna angularis]|uniref:Uncharacterized protein n=1 Tax=Phaseolus angularis TaxID=3914 RepID=A0A8T0JSD0_PHAAN|nr:uncharacterized protein HKW66_Vig0205010 [Vigna angularis]
MIAHGFLLTKAFSSSWCMHHHNGECVQDGFFSCRLHNMLLNIRFWVEVSYSKHSRSSRRPDELHSRLLVGT